MNQDYEIKHSTYKKLFISDVCNFSSLVKYCREHYFALSSKSVGFLINWFGSMLESYMGYKPYYISHLSRADFNSFFFSIKSEKSLCDL
jgi:hypothetical protein